MAVPQITLVGKPGCHLCDDARTAITAVLNELNIAAPFYELSILDDAELFDRYSEEIPVVLINDKVHTIWWVDVSRLRTALTAVSQ